MNRKPEQCPSPEYFHLHLLPHQIPSFPGGSLCQHLIKAVYSMLGSLPLLLSLLLCSSLSPKEPWLYENSWHWNVCSLLSTPCSSDLFLSFWFSFLTTAIMNIYWVLNVCQALYQLEAIWPIGRSPRLQSQTARAGILILLLISSVTLGVFFNLFGPHFFHL